MRTQIKSFDSVLLFLSSNRPVVLYPNIFAVSAFPTQRARLAVARGSLRPRKVSIVRRRISVPGRSNITYTGNTGSVHLLNQQRRINGKLRRYSYALIELASPPFRSRQCWQLSPLVLSNTISMLH